MNTAHHTHDTDLFADLHTWRPDGTDDVAERVDDQGNTRLAAGAVRDGEKRGGRYAESVEKKMARRRLGYGYR